MVQLARKGQIKEAMLVLEEKNIDRYLTSHEKIEKSLRSIYLQSKGAQVKFNFDKFHLPTTLKENLLTTFHKKKNSYVNW
jgi:hypothetical protein